MPRANQWSTPKQDYITDIGECLDALNQFVGYPKRDYYLAVLRLEDAKNLSLLLDEVVQRLHRVGLPPAKK
jgi:hypothetical protein